MNSNLKSKYKRDSIIDAAQRLFGIYGVEKVSMLEIAGELRKSKASIYYYFPDKESLYLAVLEKEQTLFYSEIMEIKSKNSDPEKMLLQYAILRLQYFRRLLNLSRFRLEFYTDINPAIKNKLQDFKKKEIEIVKQIIESGINTGIFSVTESETAGSLFLDLLRGLRLSYISGKSMLVISQEDYDKLLEKTTTFARIFINGMKKTGSEKIV